MSRGIFKIYHVDFNFNKAVSFLQTFHCIKKHALGRVLNLLVESDADHSQNH
jgi:hypothetical protein